ncbi:GntR family transcriptional regulator [Salinibacterium hongtaonis]|uniref:HTH gntR-type domain-containing protein n=1 Tax=Homoserinimonas hongtaonis TaxID=2079791 RepID=A0A2U1T1F9_9MICO|nr:GntR family transcriptional regulator [Salinibacterium hongtaonis]PWB97712.1 hypothetical protein DF220_07645 [Salinibacterium hongtaonis]
MTDAEVTSSPVVATLYDHLLDEIHQGVLQPGDRISDGELAKRFGVSRTPVREAIQRLRDIGVIEASANRFTRVAVVTPRQTMQAMNVWIILYRALVEEVTPRVTDEAIALMEADHAAYLDALEAMDFSAIARTNFDFYSRLRSLSTNDILVRSIASVVHMVRLGSLYLPKALDVHGLADWQQALIDAAKARDVSAAVAAVNGLYAVPIPQSEAD